MKYRLYSIVFALIACLFLVLLYLGQDGGDLLVEHRFELGLSLLVQVVLLAELLCQVLGSISFIYHDPLLVCGSQIHVHEKQGVVLVFSLSRTLGFLSVLRVGLVLGLLLFFAGCAILDKNLLVRSCWLVDLCNWCLVAV